MVKLLLDGVPVPAPNIIARDEVSESVDELSTSDVDEPDTDDQLSRIEYWWRELIKLKRLGASLDCAFLYFRLMVKNGDFWWSRQSALLGFLGLLAFYFARSREAPSPRGQVTRMMFFEWWFLYIFGWLFLFEAWYFYYAGLYEASIAAQIANNVFRGLRQVACCEMECELWEDVYRAWNW